MRETAVKATDEELMFLLCAAVDRNAADPIFHEVYERYHARVVSWCYRVAPDRAAEQNELAARLLRLMSRILEPMEVRVMTLHYAHDVSLAAITHDLGLRNPSGAKAYIVNARRKLFGKLRRQRHGEEFWKIDAAA